MNKHNENFVSPDKKTGGGHYDGVGHGDGDGDSNDGSGSGSKWTLVALREYLNGHGYNVDVLWQRINHLIVATIYSTYDKLTAAYKVAFPHGTRHRNILLGLHMV